MSKAGPRHFSRHLHARCAAALAVLTAASWGPLAHTLKLVETDDGGERSVRVMLARDYAAPSAAAKKSLTDVRGSGTERLLNAAPDNLQAAQTIHFEIEVPLVTIVFAPSENEFARHAAFEFSLPYTHPPDDTLARGPPA